MSIGVREPLISVERSIACPFCGRPIHPAIYQFHHQLKEQVARLLRSKNPAWTQADGACPDCAFDAAQQALSERSASSLQHELLLPFPVYSRDEAQIIPTPQRVQANPKYAGRGVTIAVLDSGFYPHPDLTRPRNRILRYVDATGTEPVEKDNFKKRHVSSWHGLMTSCVAAGNGFMSGYRYEGIAHRANLVLVKTGDRRGRRIQQKDIYRALSWVVAHRHRDDIRIVNISLGGDYASSGQFTELDELVEEAVARGMVVVTATGNSGAERISAPASAASAITVGGLDDQNSLERKYWRLYHSNYGRGVNGAAKPEVIAPANWLAAPMLPNSETHNEGMFLWRLIHASDKEFERALETQFAQSFFKQRTLRLPFDEIRKMIRGRMIEQKFIHAHYQHVDGTSFAAPIVSSIAAQMLEANPSLTPLQIKQILQATAQPLELVPHERQGHGAVHAGKAVAAALRAPNGALAGLPLSPYITSWAISFYYYDEDAREVALAGNFNDWQPGGYEFHQRARGVWQLTIPPLPPGTYRYKFLIDQSRWTHDPENANRCEDGYGGFHSMLTI